MPRRAIVFVLCVGWAVVGCQREEEPTYVWNASTLELKLPDEVLKTIRTVLDEQCGTLERPKTLGAESTDPYHFKYAAAVYKQRCQSCHGAWGDGAGPAAAHLDPKPRNYRRGIFKFTSTGPQGRATRTDLLNVLRNGVKGTSMPSFRLVPDADLQAVVDYVMFLTHRGELETMLALAAQDDSLVVENKVDPEVVKTAVEDVLKPWREARNDLLIPLTKAPPLSAESIAAGKQAFADVGCVKCHGPDGRGQTKDNAAGRDTWGFPSQAADLTIGMFRGGRRDIDIYRRVFAGIKGSAMPSNKEHPILSQKPETYWLLVHFVKSLSRPAAPPTAAQPTSAAQGDSDGQ